MDEEMSDISVSREASNRNRTFSTATFVGTRERMLRDMDLALTAAEKRGRRTQQNASPQPAGFPKEQQKGINADAINPLNHKLNQVEHLIDEFFDDRELQISQKSAGGEAQRTLPSLAAYMRRVPIVPGAPRKEVREATHKRAAAKRERPKKTVASVFATLHLRTLDQILLKWDIIVTLLSLSGVVLMMVGAVIGWESRRPPCHEQEPLTAEQRSIASLRIEQIGDHYDDAALAINALIIATSLAAIGAIVRYHTLILQQKQQEWCRLNDKEIMARDAAYEFARSRYMLVAILEVVLHLAIPTPLYNSSVYPNVKYLELVMFFRIYTLMRLMYHLSPLYRFRYDIVESNPELKSANFRVKFLDTMKVYMFDYTWASGLLMWSFCTVVGGFVVWVAERDSNNGANTRYPAAPGAGFCTFIDGIYYMVVSVRTIGFGDLLAITFVGRAATIVFQFAGMAVETLLGSVIIVKIAKTKEEKIIDEYLLAFHAWHELRVASAMLIQATWKTCPRYKYLHHKLSRDHMERLLRRRKRHKDFLAKITAGATTFMMPTYEDVSSEAKALQIKGMRYRFASDYRQLNQLGLNKILMHFADHKGVASEVTAAPGSSSTLLATTDPTAHIYERMPYLRKKIEIVESEELVQQYKKMFTTDDVDLARWGRNVSSKAPRGFNPFRKFTATKRVVGSKFGERRVPIGEGHKADIQQEALKFYRLCRQNFKMSIATSSDHVVDTKLFLAYELLVDASRKVRRNNILLKGLRRVAEEQLDAIDRLVTLSASGGVDM